jgi:hypothetical protein
MGTTVIFMLVPILIILTLLLIDLQISFEDLLLDKNIRPVISTPWSAINVLLNLSGHGCRVCENARLLCASDSNYTSFTL